MPSAARENGVLVGGSGRATWGGGSGSAEPPQLDGTEGLAFCRRVRRGCCRSGEGASFPHTHTHTHIERRTPSPYLFKIVDVPPDRLSTTAVRTGCR